MKSLLAKMLLVQKALKPIPKDETNPHFKSKYFDINGVVAQLRPILNDVGLIVVQPLDKDGITTIVTDAESGELMAYSFPIPETQDLQKLGGAITYLRRYALVSLFLLEAEDDDGNSASQSQPAYQTAARPAAAPVQGQIGSKPCAKCGKSFVPKFEWATDCYACYKAAKDGEQAAAGDAFDQAMSAPF